MDEADFDNMVDEDDYEPAQTFALDPSEAPSAGGLSQSAPSAEGLKYARQAVERYYSGNTAMNQQMGALQKQQQDRANQARDVLRQARAQLAAKKYNNAPLWLAASAALGAPTRTGSFAESVGNMSGALIPQLKERREWDEHQTDQLGKYDQALSDYGTGLNATSDEMIKLQLLQLQQKMAADSKLAATGLGILGRGTTTGAQPELIKLQNQLRTLPPGDPARKAIEDRIRLITTRAPKTDPNASYDLTDADKNTARMIWDYSLNPSTGLSRTTGEKRQEILNYIHQLDTGEGNTFGDEYSEQGYKQTTDAIAALNNMTNGRPGQQLVGYNTIINHLDTMRELAAALKNGQVKGANAVKNWLSTHMGEAEVPNFQSGLMLVAPELAKAVSGGNTGVEERTALQKISEAASSPQQFAGLFGSDPKFANAIVGVLPKLLAGKMSEMRRGFYGSLPARAAPRYQGVFERKLSPQTIRLMQEQKVEGFSDPATSAVSPSGEVVSPMISAKKSKYLQAAGGQ